MQSDIKMLLASPGTLVQYKNTLNNTLHKAIGPHYFLPVATKYTVSPM